MNSTKQARHGLLAALCGGMLFTATTQAQDAPPLGAAENFAVLGASAVTNTGATIINGDVGIWPNTASSITGFPPGVVVGTVHAGDAVAQQAQSDLTTAYNFVAGQACDTDLTGQDLGGLTLTPGVYCLSDSAQITGTLSLDALGDGAAVFIFQIGSTLTLASSARVELVNAGSDCNVFWQVGSSATLGTSSVLAGNILALTSITLNTSASVSGRAMARTGAVTLDTNTVAICAGCPPIELAPATLPNGVLDSAYSQLISASGGTSPYGYALVDGNLPTGLNLNPASGELSGTPTASGSFTFTVEATDTVGCFGSRIYTIVINDPACPTLLVLPDSLPDGVLGEAYAQSLSASGGTQPYSFSVTAGTLPPGLLLDTTGPASASISGLPSLAGSFTFTVTATDADGCLGARIYTVVVAAAVCPLLSLTPSSLDPIIATRPYQQTFTAAGGTSPYSILLSSGALPNGLQLAASGPSTALLSGMPLGDDSFAFVLTATDADGCWVSASYSGAITGFPAQVAIPATSHWGLLLLMLLLPLVALLAFRR